MYSWQTNTTAWQVEAHHCPYCALTLHPHQLQIPTDIIPGILEGLPSASTCNKITIFLLRANFLQDAMNIPPNGMSLSSECGPSIP